MSRIFSRYIVDAPSNVNKILQIGKLSHSPWPLKRVLFISASKSNLNADSTEDSTYTVLIVQYKLKRVVSIVPSSIIC